MKCGFCWKSSKDDNMNDECGAGSPSPTTTHTQCLPQQLVNISTGLYNKPVFTWRAHTTLPEAVGAFQGLPPATQHLSVPEMERKSRCPKFSASITLAVSTQVVGLEHFWSKPPWPPLLLHPGFVHGVALLGPNYTSFREGKFSCGHAPNALLFFNRDRRIWKKWLLGQNRVE